MTNVFLVIIVFHPNNVQRIEIGEGGVKPPEEVEMGIILGGSRGFSL